MGCSLSGTDDANKVVRLRVRDDGQASGGAQSYYQESFLTGRMVGIGNGSRQRIAKHRGRLLERDAVVLAVRLVLFRIPRKLHPAILHPRVSRGLTSW